MIQSKRQDASRENDDFACISVLDEKKEPSAKEMFEFYLGGSIYTITLIVVHFFVPLPAYPANTLPIATISKSQSLPKSLPSGRLQTKSSQPASREAASASSALSPSQTGSRSVTYSSSGSEYSLSSARSRSFFGTSVRLQNQPAKTTRAIFRFTVRQRVNSNDEEKGRSENSLTWQGDPTATAKTALEVLQNMTKKDTTSFKTFMEEHPVTNKNLISLARETSQKLTDCTLSTREELKILYPVMAEIFNYFNVNASLFSNETEYDLLDQRITCTRFLLTSEFNKSDSFLNSIRHNLGIYRPSSCIMPAQVNWPQEWKHEWQNTFKTLKKDTADELAHVKKIGLGIQFEEDRSHVYCHIAKVCSISQYYLIKKTAQAFEIFCSARSGGAIPLEEVLPKINTLYENESLSSFFDKEYNAYYNAILSDSLSSKPSDNLERLCNENIGYRRPISSAKNANRYPYPYPYAELNSLTNFELFKLAVANTDVASISSSQEPKDNYYLN